MGCVTGPWGAMRSACCPILFSHNTLPWRDCEYFYAAILVFLFFRCLFLGNLVFSNGKCQIIFIWFYPSCRIYCNSSSEMTTAQGVYWFLLEQPYSVTYWTWASSFSSRWLLHLLVYWQEETFSVLFLNNHVIKCNNNISLAAENSILRKSIWKFSGFPIVSNIVWNKRAFIIFYSVLLSGFCRTTASTSYLSMHSAVCTV